MPMPVAAESAKSAEPAKRVAALMRAWSLEATHPTADEIAGLAGTVPAGTRIYVSAVPGHPYQRNVETARWIRTGGFEPVPHLAVRNHDRASLKDFLQRLAGEADVRRVLVIAGDRDQPAGPYGSALDVIVDGILTEHGIAEVGIAGYPDGHPRILPDVLERALADKIPAAQLQGLGVHIVTQFCFEPERIVAWLRRLRAGGVAVPVRIGMAGPASITALLRYARRCGVAASMRILARQADAVHRLMGDTTPDIILRSLAEASGAPGGSTIGEVAPHFFSFGGLAATVRFANAVAAGRVDLGSSATGFRVLLPRGDAA